MLYGFATCVPAVLVVVFVNRNSQSLLEKTPRADLRAATSGTIGAFVSKENRLGGHGAQYIEYGTLRSDIGLHITRLYCQKKRNTADSVMLQAPEGARSQRSGKGLIWGSAVHPEARGQTKLTKHTPFCCEPIKTPSLNIFNPQP